MGDLFIGHDMPEPPKESFFRGLFGGGSRSLDREELCKLYSVFPSEILFIFLLLCLRNKLFQNVCLTLRNMLHAARLVDIIYLKALNPKIL